MIKPETRMKIKGYLEGFIQGMIQEHKQSSGLKPNELRPTQTFSSTGDIKPFHEALLPNGILLINEFERTFSTRLGTTFEECAKLIAKDRFAKAERGHRLTGKISLKALRTIEGVVNDLGSKRMIPYPEMIQRVLEVSDGKTVERTRIADVYLCDKDGNEIFIEVKSPKPNKGQCLEVTDRMLQIHAIKKQGPPKVRTFFAMAYNPYGDNKSSYKHSFTLNYLDIKNQVLIGKEFWDIVGGPGTYEEVLEIYREVGKEKGPDMLDQLALGY
ncbi:MAG: TdeIII family type II restriction endonuclease [Thaumarchaeota archaeon]|nr:TdeIII family type II restriction endonuclease [Nitrososphaerota archaeon]